jgi:hypothetical protein
VTRRPFLSTHHLANMLTALPAYGAFCLYALVSLAAGTWLTRRREV